MEPRNLVPCVCVLNWSYSGVMGLGDRETGVGRDKTRGCGGARVARGKGNISELGKVG